MGNPLEAVSSAAHGRGQRRKTTQLTRQATGPPSLVDPSSGDDARECLLVGAVLGGRALAGGRPNMAMGQQEHKPPVDGSFAGGVPIRGHAITTLGRQDDGQLRPVIAGALSAREHDVGAGRRVVSSMCAQVRRVEPLTVDHAPMRSDPSHGVPPQTARRMVGR